MGTQLVAVVAQGKRGRVYLAADAEQAEIAASAQPRWGPYELVSDNTRSFATPLYGLSRFGDLFTPRQLVAMTTFVDLLGECTARISGDAAAAGFKLSVAMRKSPLVAT